MSHGELGYRRLVESMPDQAIIMVDNELRVLLATGEQLGASGYDPSTVPGTLLEDVIPQKCGSGSGRITARLSAGCRSTWTSPAPSVARTSGFASVRCWTMTGAWPVSCR